MNPREELLKRATDIVLHGRTITYPSISSAEEVRNVMAELIAALRETSLERLRDKPHKVMTPEEYAAMPLQGWHEVCRDVDGFGGVGVRYLGV